MDYLKAFLIGGLICAVGQALIDYTKVTAARILVGFVILGVLLSALGLYGPLVEWAGNGATTPITGFGHSLAKSVKESVAQDGLFGVLTGGLKGAAAGLSASIFAAFIITLISRPKSKS